MNHGRKSIHLILQTAYKPKQKFLAEKISNSIGQLSTFSSNRIASIHILVITVAP